MFLICYWVLRSPSWLPRKWSVNEDVPRRFLIAGLLMHVTLVVILILITQMQYAPYTFFYDFLLQFFGVPGVIMVVVGVITFTSYQVFSFERSLERSIKSPPHYWFRSCILPIFIVFFVFFGIVIVFGIVLSFGGLIAIISSLIVSFGVGVFMVGVIPTYFLMRSWERRNQEKLLFREKRIFTEPWKVTA